MSDIAIKTNCICKKYKTIKACHNISMTVKRGTVYGLIGRNGAGKTTFMRALLGMTNIDFGTIEMLDKKNSELSLARKKCGFIIEEPAFYEKMSAFDNLMIKANILGLDNKKQKVEEALNKVNLSHKANEKVKNFSLGMKQILGIASAILGNPEILILDEPMNGLDPIAIKLVREILISLKDSGTAILISSHILSEIQKLCTVYGFILDGELVKEISAKEVAEKNINLEEMFVEIAKGSTKPVIKKADEAKPKEQAKEKELKNPDLKKADEVKTVTEVKTTTNEQTSENPKGDQ